MERGSGNHSKALRMLKALLASYVITGVLLLALAALLYKLELDEKAVSAGVIAIYVVSTLAGGLLLGRAVGTRRFLWGLLLGVFYFLFLLLISLLVYRTPEGNAASILTAFVLCAGGGMLGGMLS